MKKIISVLCCLVIALSLSGCVRKHTLKDPESYLKLVVRVDVVGRLKNEHIYKTYVHQQKMEAILNYLRLLKPRGPADVDPELYVGDSYTITVHYSDGHKQIYRQHADRFLSTDANPWRNIDPEFALYLYPLLNAMPNDFADPAS